jgi:hypothetical protein
MEEKLQVFTDKELRWDYYPMFRKLMDKGCEIEAYMFILATWNFARFRYAMKEFDLDAFMGKVKRLAPLFEKIQNEDFATMNIDKYVPEIKTIFETFANIGGIEATGAPKLMHLKLPKVFVMWDRYIRNEYGYKKGDADDYIAFLKHMQKEFANFAAPEGRTLAKAIDEHNYKKFTMPALAKARKKRKKS